MFTDIESWAPPHQICCLFSRTCPAE